MKEHCKAEADTKARIPGTNYVFTPPQGWVYAQLEEATVAQHTERGPVLLLTTYEPVHAVTKRSRKRTQLIASLTELVGIKPAGGSVVLFRPNEKSQMAGLAMSLWERPGARRGEAEGSLLILEAQVGERQLFGVGYAPANDAAGTSAILATIESLQVGGSSSAQDDDASGGEQSEDEKK